MMYLIFDTEAEAKEYSHNEAVKRGHGKPNNTVQYWWIWRETIDGKWAVQCPEGTKTPTLKEYNNEID